MTRSRKGRRLCSLAIIVLFLFNAVPGGACGPFSPQAVFTHALRPDDPLDNFARGDLEVLRPAYARSYLFVAYRYLTDRPLDKEEQAGVVSLWQERLNGTWQNKEEWVKDWLAARKKINGVGAPLEIGDTFRVANQRYWYANCLEDTFRSAITTLEKRVKQFGPDSAEIREWIKGQDQVLSNCSSGEAIPEPIPAAKNALLHADRAYQIAAAHFYAGRFDNAEKSFRTIAEDRASPWSTIAPYLAVRSIVRKAMLSADSNGADLKTLSRAESGIEAITGNERLKEIHGPARRLHGVLRLRATPTRRLTELAGEIVKLNGGQDLKQNLSDYTWLLDRIDRPARSDDLTDWILTYQQSSAAALEHGLAQWRQSKSIPWLIVVLEKSVVGQKHIEEVLNAASAIGPSSPAYWTVAFHRFRLMKESGNTNQARQLLDQLLAGKPARSATNLFLAQRMELAQTLEEFLQYAPRRPAVITTYDSREPAADQSLYAAKSYFDDDAMLLFNRYLPLEILKQASLNRTLPEHLQRDLVAATWLRAIALGNDRVAAELKPQLERLAPELRSFLQTYSTAASAEEKHFAAIYLILKHPGLRPHIDAGIGRLTNLNRIDDFKDNWWCSAPGQVKQESQNPSTPAFLTDQQRKAAQEESAKLDKLATAPNYLGERVIAWAKRTPSDQRVPEALHLAVNATRFGCNDKDTGKTSHAAFQLLHSRYPKSEWAKKTPYWYQ